MFPALRRGVPVLAARRRIRRRARRAIVPDPLAAVVVVIIRRLRLCLRLVQHQSRLARQRRRRQGRRRRVARHLRARHRRRERQRQRCVRVPALEVGGGDGGERGGGEEHARAVWRGGRGGALAVCAQGGHRWQRQGGHGQEGGARTDGRRLEGRGGALHEEGLPPRCCLCGLRVEERGRAAAAESVQRLLLQLRLSLLLLLLSLSLLLTLSDLLLLRLVLDLDRPALELQRGDGLLEARRDDRRRARRVEVPHRVLQALPLQALCDERRDVLAPCLVARPALALLALRRHRRRRRRRPCRRWRGTSIPRPRDLSIHSDGLDGLILVRRAERVLGEAALVLGQGALRLRLPDLALLEAEVVPHHADDLGQRAVVALDAGRHVLRLDERRAEEDERVGRARDVLRRDAPIFL